MKKIPEQVRDDILSSFVCRLLEPFFRLTLTAMTLFTAWILSADASRMKKIPEQVRDDAL
jgi:hypothetical protein